MLIQNRTLFHCCYSSFSDSWPKRVNYQTCSVCFSQASFDCYATGDILCSAKTVFIPWNRTVSPLETWDLYLYLKSRRRKRSHICKKKKKRLKRLWFQFLSSIKTWCIRAVQWNMSVIFLIVSLNDKKYLLYILSFEIRPCRPSPQRKGWYFSYI